MPKQLECRVVIRHRRSASKFDLGMYDPRSGRYEPLGSHPTSNIDKIVRDLKVRMEKERHLVTFTELEADRELERTNYR
jgi:hypothetical protein